MPTGWEKWAAGTGALSKAGLGFNATTGKYNVRGPGIGSAVAKGDLPPGWVTIRASDDPSLAIRTELGDAAPRVTQGYGGWEEVERTGRAAITHWQGFQPVGIELELFIDRFAQGESVEDICSVLEALAGRGRRATGGKPPLVIVNTGGSMPHDEERSPDNRWIINELEWQEDETIIDVADRVSYRVRTAVTVTLLQFVGDERLEDKALAARRRVQARRKGARRRYTVKSGENLVTIARKELGDPGRWREIATLNGIRDPRAVKRDAVIRLP